MLTQTEDECTSHEKHEAKVEKTHDMEMIFSASVMVKFKKRDGSSETKKGRWCGICKYVSYVNLLNGFDAYLVALQGRS